MERGREMERGKERERWKERERRKKREGEEVMMEKGRHGEMQGEGEWKGYVEM